MKILINFLSSYSGGAKAYLQSFINYYKSHQNELSDYYILIHAKQKLFLRELDIASNIIVVESKLLQNRFRFIFESYFLQNIIRKYNIAKIFTPYQIGHTFPRIENILMIRNMDPFTFTKYPGSFKSKLRNYFLYYLSKRSLNNVEKIIAVSEHAENYIVNKLYINRSSIKVIHHGRNYKFESTNALSGIKKYNFEKNNYIFTSGSLFPYRKLEDIIDAFSLIAGKTSLKLVIAGSGTDKKYTQFISSKISNSKSKYAIIMLGNVSYSEMPFLYRNCKFFITASKVEACPNIAIEALTSGCSIISSDSQPMPEMFGDAALYYNSGNILELSERIIKLNNDVELRSALGKKAIERSKFFDWEKTFKKTIEFINQ